METKSVSEIAGLTLIVYQQLPNLARCDEDKKPNKKHKKDNSPSKGSELTSLPVEIRASTVLLKRLFKIVRIRMGGAI